MKIFSIMYISLLLHLLSPSNVKAVSVLSVKSEALSQLSTNKKKFIVIEN